MRTHYVLFAALLLGACATPCTDCVPVEQTAEATELAALWAENAAEYQAVSAQVYALARRDLQRFLEDASWTALPGPQDIAGKPPAIILDVDETVVSNAGYQKTLAYAPYTRLRHFTWMRDNKAVPIRGAAETIEAARALGIEVFFVTNRACEEFEGVEGSCPAEQVTIDDLRETGVEADAEHVLMAWEQPDWSKEKLHRREYVAKTHRVIMLFGDDYGDFVHCTREKPLPPCTEPATRASRHAALDTYAEYWGNGWYILPNPMHGSWTTVR
jgi:acid phosphatase